MSCASSSKTRTGQPWACPGHPPWRISSAGTWFGLEKVAGDGVGDDEDFPHDGGEGDFSGPFVAFDEAAVEVAQAAGVADGGSRRITMESIRDRVERLAKASVTNNTTETNQTRRRGRKPPPGGKARTELEHSTLK